MRRLFLVLLGGCLTAQAVWAGQDVGRPTSGAPTSGGQQHVRTAPSEWSEVTNGRDRQNVQRHIPTPDTVGDTASSSQIAVVPDDPGEPSADLPNAATNELESTTENGTWTNLIQPERLLGSLQLVVTMTAVGLVPALLLMTTSYVRITIVLALLRQAFGMQQLLPAQVTTALAMLCTGLVMWPTWSLVHERAIEPWIAGQETVNAADLWDEGAEPVREFMIRQIQTRGNVDDIHLFLRHAVATGETYPSNYGEVPLRALLPAFLLSELKTAFLIGFQIYLPFLVIDLVVAAITTSMGMFMLPPATVSLPLKLLLFLTVDGWHLVVEMLLQSF